MTATAPCGQSNGQRFRISYTQRSNIVRETALLGEDWRFAWSVPGAFAGALSGMQFGVGDVLYSSVADRGRGQVTAGNLAVQVREAGPPGWDQALRIDLYSGSWQEPPSSIESTFGGLYLAAWHGLEGYLGSSEPDPRLPTSTFGRHLNHPSVAKALAARVGGPAFLMLCDDTSKALFEKRLRLNAHFRTERVPFPNDSSFSHSEIPPTAVLHAFRRKDGGLIESDEVREVLGLAKPKRGTFNASPHGLLM